MRFGWDIHGNTGEVTRAEQTIRDINKEFLFHVLGGPAYSVIPAEILADDFSFTDLNGIRHNKAEVFAMNIEVFGGKVNDRDRKVFVQGDTATATGVIVEDCRRIYDRRELSIH